MEELSDKLKVERGPEGIFGKTHDQLMELRRHPQKRILNKENSKTIGYSKFDSTTKKFKFVYSPRYRLIRVINKTRSTIQNYFSKN